MISPDAGKDSDAHCLFDLDYLEVVGEGGFFTEDGEHILDVQLLFSSVVLFFLISKRLVRNYYIKGRVVFWISPPSHSWAGPTHAGNTAQLQSPSPPLIMSK